MDQRTDLLEKITAYKSSTNNDDRIKLAAEIYKSYWSSQASIVSATVGAKGRVLSAKLKLKGDMMGAVTALSSEYSMDGAPKEAHTLVSDFRSSLTGLLPLDQTMSPDNMSAQLLQRVAADLQKVADPNLQKRVLSAMNAEMAAYGQPTITEAILSLQGQENIDLSPEERELLGATERIGAIEMNDTAEYARIKLQEESLDGEIEAENKKIGGGLGKGPDG